MDAAILIVGSEDFLTGIQNRIPHLAACSIVYAASVDEAVDRIQENPPDLVILQAQQSGSLELCHRIREQPHLAWIYCILVGETQENQKLADETALLAEALEEGADAYLWITPGNPTVRSHEQAVQAPEDRLLYAQVQSGLRLAKNHRDLIRTNGLLSAIALSDPLTELNNRRALEWDLPRQILNARARGIPLSLLMIDVDHFKRINDTYGHLVGDMALQLLSSRLRKNLRFYDIPFRYGGEEFVIILSNTDVTEAPLVAHRLGQLIADRPFCVEGKLDLTITISAGIATLIPEDDPRGLSLLQRADQNLLRAKSEGRNRVVSSEGSLSNLEPEESGLKEV